ncbi:MAG: hypothetical protein H0T95_01900 [Chthoniobacterales bacterium]|nr:hypothetical protein [Chthoniobacterales bacterium]
MTLPFVVGTKVSKRLTSWDCALSSRASGDGEGPPTECRITPPEQERDLRG